MVRHRVALALAFSLWAAAAAAQTVGGVGLLTGHLGAGSGGDVRVRSLTLGASLTVVENNGLGAELDLGHVRVVDAERFAESGITTLNVGPVWMVPHPTVRPFIALGAGLFRVRATALDGATTVNRTDWGFAAGGGVVYNVSDALAVRGDLRYHRLFDRHDDVPLLNGGFFDFWRTSIGLSLTWPLR